MNEEQKQQPEICSQDQAAYPVEPVGNGEGASVLKDCPSTKPWTDLNAWLEKRRPIEIVRLRKSGVSDPEDVFQDIVIGFIKKSETDPATWRNLGLRRSSRGKDAYRKQVRDSARLEFLPGDLIATAPASEDSMEVLQIGEEVGLLLQNLSAAKVNMLTAYYAHGRTLKEISQDPELGEMSVPALKSQLHRTREELRQRCIELFGSLEEARNHLGLGQGY